MDSERQTALIVTCDVHALSIVWTPSEIARDKVFFIFIYVVIYSLLSVAITNTDYLTSVGRVISE
jgi:hypothetical protein